MALQQELQLVLQQAAAVIRQGSEAGASFAEKPQPATSCTNISRGKVPHKFQFNGLYDSTHTHNTTLIHTHTHTHNTTQHSYTHYTLSHRQADSQLEKEVRQNCAKNFSRRTGCTMWMPVSCCCWFFCAFCFYSSFRFWSFLLYPGACLLAQCNEATVWKVRSKQQLSGPCKIWATCYLTLFSYTVKIRRSTGIALILFWLN